MPKLNENSPAARLQNKPIDDTNRTHEPPPKAHGDSRRRRHKPNEPVLIDVQPPRRPPDPRQAADSYSNLASRDLLTIWILRLQELPVNPWTLHFTCQTFSIQALIVTLSQSSLPSVTWVLTLRLLQLWSRNSNENPLPRPQCLPRHHPYLE